MAVYITRFTNGLQIIPVDTLTIDEEGDLQFDGIAHKLSLHNGTSRSPVVTEAHAATLTNKTIDADLNTITNIDNGNIKEGADIERDKLASGTAYRILANDVNGVMSENAALTPNRMVTVDANGQLEDNAALTFHRIIVADTNGQLTNNAALIADRVILADANGELTSNAALTTGRVVIVGASGHLADEAQLSPTRGGTGVNNGGTFTYGSDNLTFITTGVTSLTLLQSGTVVTEDGTQTLSNKVLTTPTIDNPTFPEPLIIAQNATPTNPSVGFVKLYPKTGNTLNWLGSDGVEHTAAESASGEAVKNWLINGNMDFWQRGLSFTSVSTSRYAADRWRYLLSGSSAVVSLLRSTDVPTFAQANFPSSYSFHVDCTTADGAVASGDLVQVQQILEGYDWAAIKGQQVTLNFWVKATKTGIYCVSFRNNATDRSYVAEYTVNTTATWEEKSITLTLNPVGGTDDFTTGTGLRIAFALMAGSASQGTANSWVSANISATSNQVNALDNAANDFRLSQVQLVIGPSASNFRRSGLSIESELELCQRYFEKSYEIDVAPKTSTGTGVTTLATGTTTATLVGMTSFFSVKKRDVPTISTFDLVGNGSTDGSNNRTTVVSNTGSGTNNIGVGSVGASSGSFFITESGTSKAGFQYHWTADSDLT